MAQKMISFWRPNRGTVVLCVAVGGALLAYGRTWIGLFFLALALANELLLRSAPKRAAAARNATSVPSGTTHKRPDAASSRQSGPQRVRHRAATHAGAAASTTGELEISRARGGGDFFRAYHVVVDGEEVGRIKRGQSRLFVLPSGRHQVYLELDSARSRSIMLDLSPGTKQRLFCRSNVAIGARLPVGEWIALEHES